MRYFTTRNAAIAAALAFQFSGAAAQAPSPAAGPTATPPQAAQPGTLAQGPRTAPVAPRSTRSPERGNDGAGSTFPGRPCTSVSVDPPTYLTLGKSQVVRLNFPATRIVVGGSVGSRAGRPVNLTPTPAQPGQPAAPAAAAPAAPGGGAVGGGVADTEITLLGPNELFFLGRKTGSMNVVLQGNDGRCVVKDIIVTIDPSTLQAKLGELLPGENQIKVSAAENTIVLAGSVSDAIKLDQVISLAASYVDSKQVVNLLRISTPQQVMLEVKIAEVSKTLLNRLGSSANLNRTTNGGRDSFSLISDFLSGGSGFVQALRLGRTAFNLDGQKNDGIVRVLAEPNIMALSGQSASFLSGGKIYIPVAQTPSTSNGAMMITLEEKEFGVGLKFTPTVLDGRVSLKVLSEVSELSQTGSPFTTLGGATAILPSMTTRRVDTTVQLGDGESFVVAGLIKNNVTEALNKFPGLGEAPVLGALFRSSEFQSDQTELMFVVTPRLVKPIPQNVSVPTDHHIVPSRADMFLNGMTEGTGAPPTTAP